MFRVVNLRTKKAWPDETGVEEQVFMDGDAAKQAALHLNAGVARPWNVYAPHGHVGQWATSQPLILGPWFGQKDVYINERDKWQVRKIATDTNWREEQHARSSSGKYKPVPWADQPEWQEWIKGEPQCDHFVHIAVDDPECIAYTKNPEAGELDIQTRTTPAKYFNKFITKDNAKYKNLSTQWIAIWTKIQSAIEFKFAYTREEIRKVYEDGPASCMCGSANRFFKNKIAPHPVEVYAGGDLAVAYIQRKSGKISARVLAWPEKKIYNRIYGDDATMLQSLLNAEGYQSGYLSGARLVLVNVSKFTKQANTYAIPSIDSYPNIVAYIKETKEFRICHSPPKPEEKKYQACGTPTGYTTMLLPYVCEHSGNTFDPKVEMPVMVYVTKTKTQVWSISKVKEHAYHCYVNKRYYSKEKCPPVETRVEGPVVLYKSPYEYKKKSKVDF